MPRLDNDLGHSPKPLTDSRLRLDTRHVLRLIARQKGAEGMPAARPTPYGAELTWTQNASGNRMGAIRFALLRDLDRGTLMLDYAYKDEPKRERLPLVTTTVGAYGGLRWWVLCPLCGNRAAVLYSGPPFACQRCHGLTYASTRQMSWSRFLQRHGPPRLGRGR